MSSDDNAKISIGALIFAILAPIVKEVFSNSNSALPFPTGWTSKSTDIRKVLCHNDRSANGRRYLCDVQLSGFEFQHAQQNISQISESDHESCLWGKIAGPA